MQIASAYSTKSDSVEATEEAFNVLIADLGGSPDFIVLATTVSFDLAAVADTLARIAPGVPLHGATSSRGVMTDQGFHGSDRHGLALLGIRDASGSFGVGQARLGDDPRKAGTDAVNQALAQADRIGELPNLIWLASAPGAEEQTIQGIQDVIGPHVPIVGGSSADDDIKGQWRQVANGLSPLQDSVVVSTLFPSTQLMYAFHSGYVPTDSTGVVTRAEGRTLWEIDGQPAAQVYDEWIGGILAPLDCDEPRAVVGQTTLHPLGRRVETSQQVPTYLLSHPESLIPGRGLRLFTEIDEGDELVLMSGTEQSLIERPGRIARAALHYHGASSQDVAGGLVVFCAGCMMAIDDRTSEIVDSLHEALGQTPFLGVFTFGEQGCFFGGENQHGNLMISVLLFHK